MPPGLHGYAICADSENNVNELHENNNCSMAWFTALPASKAKTPPKTADAIFISEDIGRMIYPLVIIPLFA